MQISRFSPLAAVATLLLASCAAGSHTVTYDLAFDVTDPEQIENLTDAAMRVVERRLDNMGVINAGREFGEDGTSLVITVPDEEGADELTRQLTDPFTMAILKQTESGAVADLTVEGHGGFTRTDIATDDFIGVEVGRDAAGNTRARILMTDAGQEKLGALFASQQGKNIGVFVRDKLISKLAVQGELTESLEIRGIPNLLIAEAFMDDVNVGLHVVYTPRP